MDTSPSIESEKLSQLELNKAAPIDILSTIYEIIRWLVYFISATYYL